MLSGYQRNPSPQNTVCAEQCCHRAKIEPDPKLARDYLDMGRRWLKLARSYQFSESLEAFAKHNKKRQDEANETLNGPAGRDRW